MTSTQQPDAIVVGAGLAGLVATYELVQAGRSVLVVDQENRNKRDYLRGLGLRVMPFVGWAERGDGRALGGSIFSGRAAGRAIARRLAAPARERVSPA